MTASYAPPLRDLKFTLAHVAETERLRQIFPGCDVDTEAAVLEAAGKLAQDVLAPLNSSGDRDGVRFESGRVFAAPGFRDAYRAFAEGGWNGVTAEADFGGQDLPKTLGIACFEMFHAANMSFGLCPTLTQAAIDALCAHGSARQKALYLPKLIAGTWSGTMNLTEPQSGSDLSHIRTRAERKPDGSYRLDGQKIFITWGDHDCAENIVHLVLARLPDAPPGTKGLSLFLAPKRLVRPDGDLGAANGIKVGGIEHKLGIHASPTCTMLYENAQAELVGAENRGLAQMFTMMNAARLQVGNQGVGIAERAFQQALAYALDRRQGRSPWTSDDQARLFDLPDIRRQLLLMKARIEAARGICFSTAVAADLACAADDGAERERAKLREELLTPIAKAWSTDRGVEIASEAIQIHGGMGFIEETGAAQHYRDARIAPIYEGTNGIQAIDLVSRKLELDDGQAVADLLSDIARTQRLLSAVEDSRLAVLAGRLDAAASAARDATAWLRTRKDQADMLAGAAAYLTLLGDTLGGWMLAKGALAAWRLGRENDPGNYCGTKIALASLYAETVLARVPAAAAAVTFGTGMLKAATPDGLGS